MADSAETVKKTVEQATTAAKATAEKAQAAGAQAFRETIDRSVAGLTEISSHGKKNLEAMVESATAAQRGAEALSQQAMAYSKKTLEQNLSAAQSLASARSVQELVELQTTFAKSAIETYLSEVTKMTDTLTASMKDSFKPINERVTASVERFQAAR
ncbi:MAG TPA: TIGR01841 family phasin [Brevundimonas sp.]|jgi:phasin family protein|uniref:phasin family protein n=1 Tax=Brevundimonas sp. TaxID=1871086 RepID=UPI002E0DD624|nr:TIGR01841 family phasin [Brevundimonas sp.]HEV7354227.1 TIGR01841 family phasin [Brevundimonas sp.]